MPMRSARRAVYAVVVVIIALAALAGCAGDTEEPASAPAAATPVAASAPTAPPTAVPESTPTAEGPPQWPTPVPVPTSPPVAVEMQPKSDLPVDQQVAKLSELVQAHLTGMNNIQRPRLNIQPDVRDDRRRGGIVVNIELNGDEYDTTVQKKAELDRLMRDTYHVLYASGYDIKEATMSAVMIGKSYRRQSVQAPITVFKTRLKQDAAESIDWSNKENLDFNQIWDTLLLSPVWKRELQEAQGGG